MELISPEHRPKDRKKRNIELGHKIANGQVVTIAIEKGRLPFFLDAASATSFKVEEIAEEGEKFPHATGGKYPYELYGDITKDGKINTAVRQLKVSSIRVTEKGYIAVSIEKPEAAKDHAPFWKNLESLEQSQAFSPPNLYRDHLQHR